MEYRLTPSSWGTTMVRTPTRRRYSPASSEFVSAQKVPNGGLVKTELRKGNLYVKSDVSVKSTEEKFHGEIQHGRALKPTAQRMGQTADD